MAGGRVRAALDGVDLAVQVAGVDADVAEVIREFLVRERDDWGQSRQFRANGHELSRWHWVYGGTCFRLSQRAHTASRRPVILSRSYAVTRGRVDALKEQLRAEARRHGLGRAKEVLVWPTGRCQL